ncbi:hypothetical protein CJ030_MR2G025509 [Morella rubra]|uniref:Uncharacterized protein n=1 Tax=Morella rubra TaxID=262757 RepID=A0A6A1WBU5_9ROSI|nr:hypothetical protein CJ030_MR2G025509 [Morella rubra]
MTPTSPPLSFVSAPEEDTEGHEGPAGPRHGWPPEVKQLLEFAREAVTIEVKQLLEQYKEYASKWEGHNRKIEFLYEQIPGRREENEGNQESGRNNDNGQP